MRGERARCAIWAGAAALAVLGWQAAMVRFHFGGNWSALFCTGGNLGVAPAVAGEGVYVFPASNGWDGQFYHYIAHDPLIRSDLWKSIDAPRLRYRRILVPATAWMLAMGDSARVDWAYRIVVLGFLFVGVYWLGRLAVRFQRHPAWGLAFCFLPATVVSIDRMAVDVALAAFTIGFVLYTGKPGRDVAVYLVLGFAALARDTGLIFIAGWCGWLLWERRFARAAVFATAGLAALGWYAYLRAHTPPFAYHSLVSIPFSGMLDRFIHPIPYPFAAPVAALVSGFDFLAVAATAAALPLAYRAWRESGVCPATIAMAAFGLLMVAGWHPGDWLSAYDYGRIFSPLLALLALRGLETGRWVWAIPLFLVVPRVVAQMGYWVVGGVLGRG